MVAAGLPDGSRDLGLGDGTVIAEVAMNGGADPSATTVRATVVQASTIFYDTPATLGEHTLVFQPPSLFYDCHSDSARLRYPSPHQHKCSNHSGGFGIHLITEEMTDYTSSLVQFLLFSTAYT